jgi:hypothetical protein
MYVESGIKHHNPNPTFQYITLYIPVAYYTTDKKCIHPLKTVKQTNSPLLQVCHRGGNKHGKYFK